MRQLLSELGVIWREIEAIECRTVIFYTYSLYPNLLQEIPFALPGSVREITPYEHSVPCRNKMLGWWERSCTTTWCDNLRLLVVGHPERMAKIEYIQLLTDWIR